MNRSRLQSLNSHIDHMNCSLSSKNSPRNTVDFEAACSVYIRFRGVNGYRPMSKSRMRSKIRKKIMIKSTNKIRTQYAALPCALCPDHNRNHSPIELQVSHFRFRVSLCPINGPRPRISPARTVEIPEATYLKLNNPDLGLNPAPDHFPLPSPPLTLCTRFKWSGRDYPRCSTRETWLALCVPQHLPDAGPLPRHAPKNGKKEKKADRKRDLTTTRIRPPFRRLSQVARSRLPQVARDLLG